jgi:hypothetical protein
MSEARVLGSTVAVGVGAPDVADPVPEGDGGLAGKQELSATDARRATIVTLANRDLLGMSTR